MSKILVVDDDNDLRVHLARAAKGDGREVFAAKDGEEAIQLIWQHEFDVIVTDLRMENDRAGIDVLKAAKEKDIYTQVIVITNYGTPEVSIETMRLGAFDYLERNSPGTNIPIMVKHKITLALEFRKAKRGKE